MNQKTEKPIVSLGLAVAAVASTAITLFVSLVILKISIQVGLLISIMILTLLSKKLGYKFQDLLQFSAQNIKEATYGLWFFFMIGALIAAWMCSGTVPSIIYYGMKLISPQMFLPTGLILCSITALCTGSSWATIGTMGIALLGIGQGLGVSDVYIVAMVVCGATFGDKMSPISDVPNFTAVACKADLMGSIRAMTQSMIPAYVLSLGLFWFLSRGTGGGEVDMAVVDATRASIAENFNVSLIALLPLLVVLVLSVIQFPSIPAVTIGIISAVVVALVFQGGDLSTVLESLNSGFRMETGSEIVDAIVNRGGIQDMMSVFSIMFLALSLGGILHHAGFMPVIIETLIKRTKTVAGLYTMVMFTSVLSVFMFGDTYMTIALNGNMYQEQFDKYGLSRDMLARITSEGGEMPAPLLPWTTYGAFVFSSLGVSGLVFAPFAFLCYLNIISSVVMAWMGIGIVWSNKNNKGKRLLSELEPSESV